MTLSRSIARTGIALAASFILANAVDAQQVQTDTQHLADQAKQVLGLERVSIVDLTFEVATGEELVANLAVPGAPIQLEMARHSVRSLGFEVRAQVEDGSWIELDSEPVRTYRGSVRNMPGSRVAASWLDDGLHGRVTIDSTLEYWIEPLAPYVPAAGPNQHVLYRTQDILASEGTCASDLLGSTQAPVLPDVLGPDVHAAANNTAELGCDADYEFFQFWGSTGAVQNRIESIINTVNSQYESDVDIAHSITTILIRTSSSQPYTRKKADQLLNQFRSEWLNNQGSVQRDVAHLFTGKSLSGSTIGIAWVGVVCNTNLHYSLVESNFDVNFACATDLSAHELGHNWGAGHCNCTSYTMNAFITCANQFSPSATIPVITSYRNSVSCLGGGDPPPPPPDPTSIHVGSIVKGTINAGQGRKYGAAIVTIVTDTNVAEAGATVTATFTGDYNETVVGVTDASGSVTLQTSTTQKGGVSFTICVDNVSGSLPYAPGDNVETCN